MHGWGRREACLDVRACNCMQSLRGTRMHPCASIRFAARMPLCTFLCVRVRAKIKHVHSYAHPQSSARNPAAARPRMRRRAMTRTCGSTGEEEEGRGSGPASARASEPLRERASERACVHARAGLCRRPRFRSWPAAGN